LDSRSWDYEWEKQLNEWEMNHGRGKIVCECAHALMLSDKSGSLNKFNGVFLVSPVSDSILETTLHFT